MGIFDSVPEEAFSIPPPDFWDNVFFVSKHPESKKEKQKNITHLIIKFGEKYRYFLFIYFFMGFGGDFKQGGNPIKGGVRRAYPPAEAIQIRRCPNQEPPNQESARREP